MSEDIEKSVRPDGLENHKPDGAEMGYMVEPDFNDLPRHTWWIKGDGGGVHIWARPAPLEGWPTEWIGGVEVHYSTPAIGGWHDASAPSHSDCWLIDGPCWHDGTSLYFRERIAPRLPHPDSKRAGDSDSMPHAYIGFELADWFRDKIASAHLEGTHP